MSIVALLLNLLPGALLFGWLLIPVGVALAGTALVRARRRTRKEAVAALIITVASCYAAIAMYRDVVAPFLPT